MSLLYQYLRNDEKHAKYVLLGVLERKTCSASWGMLGG